MPTSLPSQTDEDDYIQQRKAELERLLKSERRMRNIVEVQIANQGGEDFAQPGLLSQLKAHQDKIENLKTQLDKLGMERIGFSPPPIQSKGRAPNEPRIYSIPLDENEPAPARARISSKHLIYPVTAAILFVIIDVILWQLGLFTRSSEVNIPIDDGFHHLGDNFYNEEYVQSIVGDRIRSLSPEGLTYKTSFELPSLEGIQQANIYLTVNHLKPRKTSPVTLFVNENLVAYLNDHVTEERFKRKQITIPLKTQYLTSGINEIFIQVEQDELEGDYEDMEFNNLGVSISQLSGQANTLFAGIVLGELILLVILVVLLRSRLISRKQYG
jgi:hypothetical protein